MYDPTLGRFLSADPYIQYPDTTQGLNRYSYVDNNPLSLTDPTGLFLRKAFKSIGHAFKSLFKAVGSLFKNPYVRLAIGIAAGFYGGIGFAQALGYASKDLAFHVAAGIAGGLIGGPQDERKLSGRSPLSRATVTGPQPIHRCSSLRHGGLYLSGRCGCLKAGAGRTKAASAGEEEDSDPG